MFRHNSHGQELGHHGHGHECKNYNNWLCDQTDYTHCILDVPCDNMFFYYDLSNHNCNIQSMNLKHGNYLRSDRIHNDCLNYYARLYLTEVYSGDYRWIDRASFQMTRVKWKVFYTFVREF